MLKAPLNIFSEYLKTIRLTISSYNDPNLIVRASNDYLLIAQLSKLNMNYLGLMI
jgi:hypothetical protein